MLSRSARIRARVRSHDDLVRMESIKHGRREERLGLLGRMLHRSRAPGTRRSTQCRTRTSDVVLPARELGFDDGCDAGRHEPPGLGQRSKSHRVPGDMLSIPVCHLGVLRLLRLSHLAPLTQAMSSNATPIAILIAMQRATERLLGLGGLLPVTKCQATTTPREQPAEDEASALPTPP